METEQQPEVVEGVDGLRVFYVKLPPIREIVQLLPSPALEDIYSEVNMELQCRDRKYIEENL